MESIASDSILARVARGDSRAVRECLDRYDSLVWSIVRRKLGSSADAEDAVQEIFVEIWKSAGRFDPSRSSEVSFIAMIARRRIIDRLRRRGRQPESESLDERHDVVEDPSSRFNPEIMAEAAMAARALEQLRPQQQEVLKLLIQEGLTHQQVSENIGMPLGTVKTHARRGLIKLRELLTSENPPRQERST